MQSRTSSRGLVLSAIIMCALALTLTHVPSFAFADDQPTTEPVVETEAVETVDPEAAAPAAEEGTANEQEVANETATAEETEVVEEEQTPEIPALLPLADPGAEIVEGDYFIETGQMLADKTGLQWLVLDAKGGKIVSGTRIITWSYSGNENQRWHVAPDGTGRYIISAYKDHDMVITATAESGRLVLTKYVPGLASQLWNFMPYSTAYGNGYQIVPSGIQKSAKDTTITELAPAKAMDVRGNSTKRGADIMTYTASSTIKGNQTYYLTPYPVKTPTEGVTDLEGKYRISVPGTNVLVEINKASTANGANVALYTGNGKAHQDIFLRHEGNGFYSIWDMGTNKVLDVRASKILPGTNILQWAYKGSDNQLWAARKNDDGTYTFINKATGEFAGLGHPVCDADTGELVPIHSGEAVPVDISDVRKGANGIPGELHGNFKGSDAYGVIDKNTNAGIFGRLTNTALDHLCNGSESFKIAYRQNVKKGEAFIYTSVCDSQPERYTAEIESIDYNGSETDRNMMIRITDQRLLDATGGIVQGMSGSPIIQDERIVGAVTHVFVADPTRGYAIFAENMLSQLSESQNSESTE